MSEPGPGSPVTINTGNLDETECPFCDGDGTGSNTVLKYSIPPGVTPDPVVLKFSSNYATGEGANPGPGERPDSQGAVSNAE